jgi:cytochrome d ubiquinol oxidase subunit II
MHAQFVDSWLGAFPFAVGILTLALFAFLAATYLAVEARESDMREDFRRRALLSGGATALAALATLLLAHRESPALAHALVHSAWSPIVLGTGAAASAGAPLALYARRFALARACAAVEATALLWGWALAQHPLLLPPDLTIAHAAAPARTLRLLAIALAVGVLVLFPSLAYLLRVFKAHALGGETQESSSAHETESPRP